MIYISIDNDYHASLASGLIDQCKLNIDDVTFVLQCSPRNNFAQLSGTKKIQVAGHPLSGGSGYTRVISYVRSIIHQRKLRAIFDFDCGDVLIVITEYQLNNAILAKKMKTAGGRVYIFDEGIGFYCNNSPYHFHVKLIDRLYLVLYNLVFRALGIPAYAKKGQEGRMFACIKDSLIDRVYSRLKLPINRSIPISGYRSTLNSSTYTNEQNRNVAIMFASNFDCFDLKEEEMHLASLAIAKMAGEFSEVYIKIHPSDYIGQNEVFSFYDSLEYENVKLLDNSLTAVQAINLYRPAVVVGTMSTSLFDAFSLGCQPIFLFHMLPAIAELGVYKFTLDALKYNFISSINDISSHYQCKLNLANLLYESNLADCFWNEVGPEQFPKEERLIA